jgi:uncharacterized OB-fold protein
MSDIVVEAPHTVDEFVKGYEESGRLRGLRCANCGLVTATWGLACSRCGRFPLDETALSPKGKVVAFTILTVPGEEFLNDAPYAYVVVDLDGGGRVTGWMPTVRAENEIAIGDRVHFVTGYKPGVQFAKDDSAPAPG